MAVGPKHLTLLATLVLLAVGTGIRGASSSSASSSASSSSSSSSPSSARPLAAFSLKNSPESIRPNRLEFPGETFELGREKLLALNRWKSEVKKMEDREHKSQKRAKEEEEKKRKEAEQEMKKRKVEKKKQSKEEDERKEEKRHGVAPNKIQKPTPREIKNYSSPPSPTTLSHKATADAAQAPLRQLRPPRIVNEKEDLSAWEQEQKKKLLLADVEQFQSERVLIRWRMECLAALPSSLSSLSSFSPPSSSSSSSSSSPPSSSSSSPPSSLASSAFGYRSPSRGSFPGVGLPPSAAVPLQVSRRVPASAAALAAVVTTSRRPPRPTIFHHGIFLSDRLGLGQQRELKPMLDGRAAALGLLAASVGASQAFRLASYGECGTSCQLQLLGALEDPSEPSLEAHLLPRVGADIVKIEGLRGRLLAMSSPASSSASSSVSGSGEGGAPPRRLSAPLAALLLEYWATSTDPSVRASLLCIEEAVDDSLRPTAAATLRTHPGAHEKTEGPRAAAAAAAGGGGASRIGETGPPLSLRRLATSDSLFDLQWHLHSSPDSFDVRAVEAWKTLQYQTTSPVAPSGLSVAVIDTGCALHQDLVNGSTSRYWKNEKEICGNGIDDDDNGFIDDCYGWDFTNDDNYPFVDEAGHGTSVSAVLAALSDDAQGSAGVWWTGRVMCLKAGGAQGLYISDTVAALDYALMMDSSISVHSYGGVGANSAEYWAFKAADLLGHLAVTAAGNSNCDVDAPDKSCSFSPGAYSLPNILNVGASTQGGLRASFSCWGKTAVDVFAPGTAILTATSISPSGEPDCQNCYGYIQGTSFSAPLVAGVAAAVWGAMEVRQPPGWRAKPKSAHLMVKDAIMFTVSGSKSLAGTCQTNGVVDFPRALAYYDNGVPGEYVPEYKDPEDGYSSSGETSAALPSFAKPLLWFQLAIALAAIAFGAA
eukprot:GHVT01065499.1.p1 GENE.GHVT01065499.1~~GHVT01065499.1.p1  ORF type:complete len:935 (-),score=317.48 GHVT01065499.1:900-3704(-)